MQMSLMRITLIVVGALLALAGILSFLVPIDRLITLALLAIGAACLVVGTWVLDE